MNQKHEARKKARKERVREKINRVTDRPRLHVYRSSRYIYAQIIESQTGNIKAAASEKTVKEKGSKKARAGKVGEALASQALKKNIKKVVFDRGPYRYHGRVKALAEGAKAKGLEF